MATFTVNFKSKNLFDNLKESFDAHQNGDEYLVNFEYFKYEDLISIVSELNGSFDSIDFDDIESFMNDFFCNMWDNSEDLGIMGENYMYSDEMIKWENDLKDFYYGY
jgi:hypothetical protein